MSKGDGNHPTLMDGDQITVTKAELDKMVQLRASDLADNYKSDSSGLRRKNQELMNDLDKLRKENEEFKKASMEESERAKFELEEERHRLAARERDLLVAENRAKAMKVAAEKGISPDLVDLAPLDSWEQAESYLSKMSEVVDNARTSALEEYKKKNGDAPPAGGGKEPANRPRRSQMTPAEANAYAKEHGMDAYRGLPA